MSTELARTQQQTPAALPDRIEYAKALAASGLLPKAYQRQPANVLYAVEYGTALGVAPMTAIMGIHVIQGKPTLSADLMAGLIRRAGHKLRIRVDDGPVAVAQVIRADDPDWTYECRWDMSRAKQADLLGKDNWKHHPASMLKARAISEVAREACSEVLNGLIYTPEELGATVGADGHVIEGEAVTTASGRESAADALINTAEQPEADGGDDPPMISSGQQKKLGALMREAQVTDRDTALAYVAGIIGREVGSRNELTEQEAGQVIDALEAAKEAQSAGADPATGEIHDAEVVEDSPAVAFPENEKDQA